MEGLDIWPHNVHTTLHTSLHLILPVVLEDQHCYANFTGDKSFAQGPQIHFSTTAFQGGQTGLWARKFQISQSYYKTI